MVDTWGRWTEEKDYSTYPKEKWCDYDHMAVFIREQGYEPETTMENLISMMFAHYEVALQDEEYYNEGEIEFTIDGCKEYVLESGISEFDYYC